MKSQKLMTLHVAELVSLCMGAPMGRLKPNRDFSKQLPGVSRYKPHQGKRECERRRLGGFHRRP